MEQKWNKDGTKMDKKGIRNYCIVKITAYKSCRIYGKIIPRAN